MRVIPVIDLLNGVVVRGVGGRRNEYRAVESCLSPSARPFDIATAFRRHLGLTTLYVADLDGIVHRRPNLDVIQTLNAEGFEVWLDAGVQSADEATSLFERGATQIVAGLESLTTPQELRRLCDVHGAARVIFSLDLKNGQPLTGNAMWPERTSLGIARTAVSFGIEQVIVLDLAQVGESRGLNTLVLCDSLRREFPHCRFITGGGVRGRDDLASLRSHGLHGVLVSTAIHNGTLTRADCEWRQNENAPV